MSRFTDNNSGYTLIELVMVILIIGVLAGVASKTFIETLDTAKFEATRAEMQALAFAIAGNPNVYTKGARTDFGYVGDVGAMPPDLDALVTNPGLSTWDGPYIKGDFDNDDFKFDGWNTAYILTDSLLRSTGSGSNIDKIFIAATAKLLSNSVSGYFLDADRQRPGAIYKDSLTVILTYPDGSGGVANASTAPNANGNFAFSGIPIGNHNLRVIYIPDSDTVSYVVCVEAGRSLTLDVTFPADLW
ncbi:MAG: prepilin-type N-terminal cleavage/methylation domain-containing protein [FCB group bacterium]|nr:prepilin-type N-terminal cleavage/methylation domain-containing protein [FCB group bacterium]